MSIFSVAKTKLADKMPAKIKMDKAMGLDKTSIIEYNKALKIVPELGVGISFSWIAWRERDYSSEKF